MSNPRQMWLNVVLLPLVTFLGLNMCVWPYPRFLGIVASLLQPVSDLAILLLLASVPAAIFLAFKSLFCWFKKRDFLQPLHKSAACLCFFPLCLLAFSANIPLRRQAFVRASVTGDRIVEAIEKFKNDKGAYPDRLEELVPEFLEEVPYTGLIAYPKFSYRNGYNDIQPKEGEYELRINCRSGTINFDRFIYWPSRTYPDRIQGNGVERLGNWAYVHE